MAKLDHLFSKIGALATATPKDKKSKSCQILRFDILRSAWQVHGYEFTNLKRFKKVKGINFNMLSVKSIRIMNRLASKIGTYREIYSKRLASSPNMDMLKQKPTNIIFAVLLALLND